jgi:carbon monoxide dehydrogenase subunit G
MKIQNEIEVAAPPDELFDVLADVERVAPLLPGANLEEKRDDDSYAGTVKVRSARSPPPTAAPCASWNSTTTVTGR